MASIKIGNHAIDSETLEFTEEAVSSLAQHQQPC